VAAFEDARVVTRCPSRSISRSIPCRIACGWRRRWNSSCLTRNRAARKRSSVTAADLLDGLLYRAFLDGVCGWPAQIPRRARGVVGDQLAVERVEVAAGVPFSCRTIVARKGRGGTFGGAGEQGTPPTYPSGRGNVPAEHSALRVLLGSRPSLRSSVSRSTSSPRSGSACSSHTLGRASP